MNFTFNGIGVSLAHASRIRDVAGTKQFDAAQSFVILFLPILTYKAVHVTDYKGRTYRGLELRDSGRIFAKAYLLNWGIGLLILGIGALAIMVALATMDATKLSATEWVVIEIAGGAVLAGVGMLLGWWRLDSRDQRIKDILGPHDLGTADPFDWPYEVADEVSAQLSSGFEGGLAERAERAIADGDPRLAMTCLRLAMRKSKDDGLAETMKRLIDDGTIESAI